MYITITIMAAYPAPGPIAIVLSPQVLLSRLKSWKYVGDALMLSVISWVIDFANNPIMLL